MRNVIVTGGSRGLGLGTAQRLVDSGYRVIAIARKLSECLSETMRRAEADSRRLHFLSFDLAEIEKIPDMIRNLRREYGPIYGLVNNAGISYDGALTTMPVAHIEQVLRVNTLSPIVMSKHVGRWMMADGGGRIINIASVAASTGYSGLAAYGASKAALVGFTRAFAREVGRMGINVNAVAPGFIETDLTQKMEVSQLDQIKRRSALRRLAKAEDVANAVEFLLSDGARNITGTVLTVDAGNTA